MVTKADIEAKTRRLRTVTYSAKRMPSFIDGHCVLIVDDHGTETIQLQSFKLAFGDNHLEHTMTSKQFFELFDPPEADRRRGAPSSSNGRKRKESVTVPGMKEQKTDMKVNTNVFHDVTNVANTSPMASADGHSKKQSSLKDFFR